MKLLFISDIHGIKTNLPFIEQLWAKGNFDYLIVLGDLYYIGPRNQMKEDYDISYVQSFLNSKKEKLICMRGNCDSNVDVEVSDFLIHPGIERFPFDGKDVYFTHGDLYHFNACDKLPDSCILIYGHEHVPYIKEKGNRLFLNPGSISLPRSNFFPTYMIYENHMFTIYDIHRKIVDQRKI